MDGFGGGGIFAEDCEDEDAGEPGGSCETCILQFD